MCADYYLIPTAISDQYPWAMSQLALYDMAQSDVNDVGRNPKPEEVRELLDLLVDFSVDFFVSEDSWQADIRASKGIPLFRRASLLNVVDFNGDESRPHLFCLESGDLHLNILIAERLSRICGPLFFIPDTGAKPLLVKPGSDPAELKQHWEN